MRRKPEIKLSNQTFEDLIFSMVGVKISTFLQTRLDKNIIIRCASIAKQEGKNKRALFYYLIRKEMRLNRSNFNDNKKDIGR